MPVERKPLFRPEILAPGAAALSPHEIPEPAREALRYAINLRCDWVVVTTSPVLRAGETPRKPCRSRRAAGARPNEP